jgi:hypothetical protein
MARLTKVQLYHILICRTCGHRLRMVYGRGYTCDTCTKPAPLSSEDMAETLAGG